MAKPLPDPGLPWPILPVGVALCADKEDLRLVAYKCIAGKWTCGWGETDGVGPRTRWTKAYADQRFCDSLTHYSDEVRAMCTGPTSDHEHTALTVIAYNIGLDALRKSTIMRQHNAGNKAAAARAFDLFNKFRNPKTGKLEVSNGLTIRRKQEAAIYVTPDDDEASEPMPQAVAPESSLVASPIAQGGTITAGAGGALSLISSVSDQANEASGLLGTLRGAAEQAAEFVGLTPPQALGLVLLGVGLWIWWQRTQQRREGWA
jgi:GH24 family phage-related lysozyme (muramidase)